MAQERRPRVITYNISSLDGRLSLPGVLLLHGDERWAAIKGDEPTDIWAEHDPQALLEGSNSFVSPDAPAADLPPTAQGANLYTDFLPGVWTDRLFVVVDSRGRVRWTQKTGEHGEHLMVLVSEATPASYLAFLRREEIPYLVAGAERVDLGAALRRLAIGLGVATVVATGGGLLNGALLRARLVDEVDIDFLPAIIGGREAPALFDGARMGAEEWPVQLTPVVIRPTPRGGLFVRYAVNYPG